MIFDQMYGAGSMAMVSNAIAGIGVGKFHAAPSVTEPGGADAAVELAAEWTGADGKREGYLTFSMGEGVCTASNFYTAPGLQRVEILTEVLEIMYPVAEAIGIEWFGIWVLPGGETERAMRLTGFNDTPGAPVVFGCAMPNPRWEEYRNWRDEGKPAGTEPVWHASLRERYAREKAEVEAGL